MVNPRIKLGELAYTHCWLLGWLLVVYAVSECCRSCCIGEDPGRSLQYLHAYWENLWLQDCSAGKRTLDYLQKDFDCDLCIETAELLCMTKDCETKTKAVYVCKNPVNNTSNTSISTTSGLVYSSQGSLSTNSATWCILETAPLSMVMGPDMCPGIRPGSY